MTRAEKNLLCRHTFALRKVAPFGPLPGPAHADCGSAAVRFGEPVSLFPIRCRLVFATGIIFRRTGSEMALQAQTRDGRATEERRVFLVAFVTCARVIILILLHFMPLWHA